MKLNRWRGGLKSGNRREKDITAGTFNAGYEIQADSVVTPNETKDLHRDLQWKVDLKANSGDTSGKLYFDRKEATGFEERSSVGDSVHSDSFYLELDVGQYNIRGSSQETIMCLFQTSQLPLLVCPMVL